MVAFGLEIRGRHAVVEHVASVVIRDVHGHGLFNKNTDLSNWSFLGESHGRVASPTTCSMLLLN